MAHYFDEKDLDGNTPCSLLGCEEDVENQIATLLILLEFDFCAFYALRFSIFHCLVNFERAASSFIDRTSYRHFVYYEKSIDVYIIISCEIICM